MGTLYLVRHGQASFGAEDYDQLSDLGRRQSVRLGEYFASRAVRFDGLIAGTLRRHKQTLEGILEGMNHAGEHLAWEGLNEYDSEAVIATVHPHKLEKPTSPEMYRHHFRLLRDGLVLIRDQYLFIPLHHQVRPWAMRANLQTLHRSNDRPEARFTTIK